MSFGLYPISELGILWLQATLTVALVWLVVRTRLMPVVVATATVYTVTIMAWMTMVRFDVPTLWELKIEGREYPVMALGALGLVTAYFVLKSMKRRRERCRHAVPEKQNQPLISAPIPRKKKRHADHQKNKNP